MSSLGGQHRTTPSPILTPKTLILGQEVLKIHANVNNPISALNVHKLPKFLCLLGNRVGAMLTPYELVFTFGGFYVCANFGENRS